MTGSQKTISWENLSLSDSRIGVVVPLTIASGGNVGSFGDGNRRKLTAGECSRLSRCFQGLQFAQNVGGKSGP